MLSDIACDGDISVNVSTGDTNMINVTCKNAISDGSTGDMLLKNVNFYEINVTKDAEGILGFILKGVSLGRTFEKS